MPIPPSSDDIAIIGMSAMFAGAPDLFTYWHNILAKWDATNEASDRWAYPFFDPDSSENDRIYTRRGGFLGDSVAFDPLAYGVMPTTLDSADADHFLGLKLAFDALRDAGYEDREFNRKATGVILGRGTYVNRGYNTLLQHGQMVDKVLELLAGIHPELDSADLASIRKQLKASLPPFSAETVPGLVPNVITGRIANRLDLMGPNYIVDAACASSIVAAEQAIKELRSGRCEMVLTGGVQSSIPPQLYMMFSQLKGLSRAGLRPFGSDADGTLLGEGLGILVLKRRADAERDGDRIYALMKGVATSSDGRALGLLAPRKEGQYVAMERAYRENAIDPTTVSLVEAHGTGMPLGDRTEVETLSEIYGGRVDGVPNRALGSVKSMIGHCIPAAGAASMIKVALALNDKVLPPTLCTSVNPDLNLDVTSLYVNNEARPWIHHSSETPRRAGVNAFGFGGVNAHAILEEYTGPAECRHQPVRQRWKHELMVFSATDKAELAAHVEAVKQKLEAAQPPELADLAYSLASREHSAFRLAFVCQDTADLLDKLALAVDKLGSSDKPRFPRNSGIHYGAPGVSAELGKVAFLFPGEGGQYPDMLADLCMDFPSVRDWFDVMDESFHEFSKVLPGQLIFPPPTCLSESERTELESQLMTLQFGSAAVFVSSMAIYDLLDKMGIACDLMLGHSTGEGTALLASEIIRLGDRETLKQGLAKFNRTYKELAESGQIPTGALLSVGAASFDFVSALVESSNGQLHIALDNCPNQIVLYGDRAVVKDAEERLRGEGAICMELPFGRAYHTPLLKQVDAVLSGLYADLEVGPGKVPVYSCATVDTFPADPAGIRMLATAQWSSRVRFRETIKKLYDEGVRTFVEIGPGSNLASFVRDSLGRQKFTVASSNIKGKDGLQTLQQLVAQLFVMGVNPDFSVLYKHRAVKNVFAPLEVDVQAQSARPKFELDLIMPELSLSPGFMAEIRSKLQISAPAQGEEQKAEPPAGPAAIAVTPQPAVAASDPRLTALQQHFGIMQDFLESQQRVMANALGGGAPTGLPTGASAEPAVPGKAVERWSFLGEITQHDGDTLECVRRLDLKTDVFLHDHTIGSALGEGSGQLPLAVIPFTGSMEIIAEAAVRLAGEHKHVVRMQDVRGYKWLALDQGEILLQIVAQYRRQEAGADVIQVRLFQFQNEDPSGDKFLVFEGSVSVAPAYPASPKPEPLLIRRPRASTYTPEMLYQSTPKTDPRYAPLFHGPVFQGVKRVLHWGSEGIEAELSTVAAERFFTHIQSPLFQVDPVLLDSAGQMIGYWVAEKYGADLSFFPFAVRDYQQFDVVPQPQEKIRCKAAIKIVSPSNPNAAVGFEILDKQGLVLQQLPATDDGQVSLPSQYYTCRLFPGDAHIEAEFEFVNEADKVIMKLSGWQDRYFSIPHAYYRCRLWPQTEYFSTPWMQSETAQICRRIDAAPMPYLEQGWGIWRRVLAHLLLTDREKKLWYSLPGEGARRSDWLLGRVAAKEAVRQWAGRERKLDLSPLQIELLPDQAGRPEVVCSALGTNGALPQVSISHQRGAVVAVVSAHGKGIGIDLVNSQDVRVVEDLSAGFTTSELERLGDNGERANWLALWSAKEAAAKANGTGLMGDPREWLISAYDARSQEATVTYRTVNFKVRLYRPFAEEILALCIR